MKSIIIILALLLRVPASAQINLFSTSSGAFYVSESYVSTKQLSNEVATDILFEISEAEKGSYVLYEFILTNERDNIYTGNMVTHTEKGFSILTVFPVSVVYDGSSVRWTIPPIVDWTYQPNNNITKAQKEKQKETEVEDEAYRIAKEEKKKKLDALISAISATKKTNVTSPEIYTSNLLTTRQIIHQGKPEFKKNINEEGIVVVEVFVNRDGIVTKAKSGIRGSTTSNKYLLEAAKEAALQTRYNKDSNAPESQIVTIRYNFVIN